MRDIIVEYDDFEKQKLLESFISFFRYVKGYADWTDEEIVLSMNEGDLKEFIEWASKVFGLKVKSQKEEKIREYIMSRNIRYDLVGEDLLAILNDEYDDEEEV